MTTTKAVLNLQSDLKQPNAPALGDDLANKDYVDSSITAAVGDATSAPGGGTKGRATADEDKGLLITPGAILEVKISTTEGIEFDGTGNIRQKISTTEGVDFNGSGELRAKIDITQGSQYSAGGAVIPRIDGATITLNGSGQLQSGGGATSTSAPGGGSLGIVTADENFGLLITAGILTVKIDPATLQFNGSGELEVIGGGSGGGATGTTSHRVGFTRNINLPSVIAPPNSINVGTEIDTLEHPDGITTGQRFEITIPEDYFDGDLLIQAIFQQDAAIAAPNNQVRLTTQAEIVNITSGVIDGASYPETPLSLITPDTSVAFTRSTILTIADGDFSRGHTINVFIKRLGGDAADLASANWNVVAYEYSYTTVVDSRIATQTVEFFGNTVAGAPPSKTLIGTEIDVLSYAPSVDQDQKFTFVVPDNWDGLSDAQIFLNYSMDGVVGSILRLNTDGEIVDIATGTINAIPSVNFDLGPTADTDPHRVTVRNIPAALLSLGSSVTIVLERTGSDGADVNADSFQLISASIAFLVTPISGYQAILVSEGYLELPNFNVITDPGIDADLTYPLFGSTLDTLVTMSSTVASGRVDVAFPGRLAATQTQIGQIRISFSGAGASPQYHLKVYAEGFGATPVFDSGLTVAPGATSELTIPAASLSGQPSVQGRYHVVVEAFLDAGETLNMSLPFVRQE